MSFTLYYVEADLAKHSDTVAGAGCICSRYHQAKLEAARLERNDRYTNVRIIPRHHGS